MLLMISFHWSNNVKFYDLKVKQLKSDHGAEFWNETLESFYEEKVFKIYHLLEHLNKTELLNEENVLSSKLEE